MLGSSSTSTTTLSRYGWNSSGRVFMTWATIWPNRRSDMRFIASSCQCRPKLSTRPPRGTMMRLADEPQEPASEEHMTVTIEEINRRIEELRAKLEPLYRELEKVIVGQRVMMDRLLVG